MISFDLVLRNGRILDGCGNPWFWGDLAIQSGRVAQTGPTGTLQGKRLIDVEGNYIAPGFIDIHTHSDVSILINRRAESAVHQGVTTHMVGNCGMSPAPVSDAHLEEMRRYWLPLSDQPEVTWQWRSFGEYLAALETGGLGINLGSLAGHAALRIATVGVEEKDPTARELQQMEFFYWMRRCKLAHSGYQPGWFTRRVVSPGRRRSSHLPGW